MSNIELKRLLQDFEVLITTQITTFKTDSNIIDTAPLDQLALDVEAQRTRLKDASIWSKDVVYKESDFATAFLDIMAIKPPNTQSLVDEFDKCVVLIDQIFQATPERGEVITNPWNLKAFEATRNIEHKMVGRTNHFLQKGINLNNDPTYTAVAEPLKTKRTRYKQSLRNNTIKADATHEIVLNRIAAAIKDEEQVPRYVHTLGALSTFLDGHTPTA